MYCPERVTPSLIFLQRERFAGGADGAAFEVDEIVGRRRGAALGADNRGAGGRGQSAPGDFAIGFPGRHAFAPYHGLGGNRSCLHKFFELSLGYGSDLLLASRIIPIHGPGECGISFGKAIFCGALENDEAGSQETKGEGFSIPLLTLSWFRRCLLQGGCASALDPGRRAHDGIPCL